MPPSSPLPFTLDVGGSSSKRVLTESSSMCSPHGVKHRVDTQGNVLVYRGKRQRPGIDVLSNVASTYEKNLDKEKFQGKIDDDLDTRFVDQAYFECLKSQRALKYKLEPSRYFSSRPSDPALLPMDSSSDDDDHVNDCSSDYRTENINTRSLSRCTTSTEASERVKTGKESIISSNLRSNIGSCVTRTKTHSTSEQHRCGILNNNVAATGVLKGYRQIAPPSTAALCPWFVLHCHQIRPSSDRRLCPYCRGSQHPPRLCPTLRCGLCGALDHAMRGCPNSGVVCRACLSTGHAEPNCPDTSRDESLNQALLANKSRKRMIGTKGSSHGDKNSVCVKGLLCITCSKKGHACCSFNLATEFQDKEPGITLNSASVYCSHCGLQGHTVRRCRRRKEFRLLESEQRVSVDISDASYNETFKSRLVKRNPSVQKSSKTSDCCSDTYHDKRGFSNLASSLTNVSYLSTLSKKEIKYERKRVRTAIKAKKRKKRLALKGKKKKSSAQTD